MYAPAEVIGMGQNAVHAPIAQRQRPGAQTTASVGSNPTRGTHPQSSVTGDGTVGPGRNAWLMYDVATRRRALQLLAAGASLNATSKQTGINRSTLREWREAPDWAMRAATPATCCRC